MAEERAQRTFRLVRDAEEFAALVRLRVAGGGNAASDGRVVADGGGGQCPPPVLDDECIFAGFDVD